MSEYSWAAPKDAAMREAMEQLAPRRIKERLAADVKAFRDRTAEAENSGDASARASALVSLGRAYARAADLPAAFNASTEARVTATGSGDKRLLAAATAQEAVVLTRQGSDGAQQAFHAASKTASDLSATDLVIALQVDLASLQLARGDVNSALAQLDDAFALGRTQQDTWGKGLALACAGCAYALTRSFAEASALLARAQLLHERAQDVLSLARTYNNQGVIHMLAGRFVDAIPYVDRSLELLTDQPDLLMVLNVLNNMIRISELQSLERAGALRDQMLALVDLLPDRALARCADMTMPSLEPNSPFGSSATFSDDPVVAGPFLLLPVVVAD